VQIIHFWALPALPSATVAGVDEVHFVAYLSAPSRGHGLQHALKRVAVDTASTSWASPPV
jgi:hypothetical protein